MRQTVIIECPFCKGTGLCQGETEKDGAAVVCHQCEGTGATAFTYESFEGKKRMEGVKRVFERTCGHVHHGEDITTPEGTVLHFSQFGCSYEDWLKGFEPVPMMELYCPYESTNPCIGVGPCNRCNSGLNGYGPINECSFYHDKVACWREWLKFTNRKLLDEFDSRINTANSQNS